MENMNLYHPSIRKLYHRKFTKMNFNLLISVFGLNQGIKILKRNHVFRGVPDHVLSLTSNLILSQEIKEKFEERNGAFICLTKHIIRKLEKNHREINGNTVKMSNRRRNMPNSFQRYSIQNNHQKYQNYVLSIILLQKNIRAYLARKNILQIINKIIIEKSIKCVISIQSLFRRYNQFKKTKITTLHKKVINSRKNQCFKIIQLLSSFQDGIQKKKRIIVDKLLDYRKEKIVLIQNNFKCRRLMKLVKAIIAYERNQYVLSYPFYAKKVQIKLFLDTNFGSKPQYQFIIPITPNFKLFSFEFCQLRKIFVLYIKNEQLAPGKYRCQLIVDGCVTCDGRFPHIECEDGQFYNLIEFTKGKMIPNGTTKKTNGSDNESKESLSDKAKKNISSDEEEKKAYVTLKKDLESNPPKCLYDKKWMKNIPLDSFNETQDDFFKNLKK